MYWRAFHVESELVGYFTMNIPVEFSLSLSLFRTHTNTIMYATENINISETLKIVGLEREIENETIYNREHQSKLQ